MKKYISICIALLAFGVPFFSHAATSITQQTPDVSSTKYTAHYTVTGAPTGNTVVKVYARLAEYGTNTWNYNVAGTSIIDISSTSQGATFNVDFPFSQLGLVAGKLYKYQLADSGVATGNILTPLTCFTTSGFASCSSQPLNPAFTTASFTVVPGTQVANTFHPGNFNKPFAITPSFNVVAPISAVWKSLKKVNGTFQQYDDVVVSIPLGSGTTTITQNNLAPGDYSAKLYSGTTQISAEYTWTITNPNAPTQPPQQPSQPQPSPQQGTSNTSTNSSAYLGGMTLWWPAEDQVVNETDATLKAHISAQLSMPVQIEVLSGLSTTQIDHSFTPTLQPASMNMGLEPGEIKTFEVPFTGLVKGTTYYFLVKNNATGTQSPVWNFTTKGGTSPIPQSSTTIYDAQTSPYADPGTGGPVIDTISDNGIVPRCGRTQNADGTVPDTETAMCTYANFMQLIANIIQFALIIIGPIIAIIVMFAGAMVLWLNYNSDPTEEITKQKKKYIGILTRAAIGIFIVMIAWVLVATVLKELGVKQEYVLLDLFSAN